MNVRTLMNHVQVMDYLAKVNFAVEMAVATIVQIYRLLSGQQYPKVKKNKSKRVKVNVRSFSNATNNIIIVYVHRAVRRMV